MNQLIRGYSVPNFRFFGECVYCRRKRCDKYSEGSTAMRCAAELGELMIEQCETIPLYLYVYSDGGPERKTNNLSVQKSYIALFAT